MAEHLPLAIEGTCARGSNGHRTGRLSGLTATEHRLDNGLRLVLSEDHLTPVAAVCLWYDVGSRQEVEGRTGLAHLFEHLMFQGSAQVKGNGHFELVQGAGGSLNGSTSFERTNYFETMPAHQLELALWLEADRMGSLLSALDAGDAGQPARRGQERAAAALRQRALRHRVRADGRAGLPGGAPVPPHPDRLDGRPGRGDADDAAFFRTYYVPNNAILRGRRHRPRANVGREVLRLHPLLRGEGATPRRRAPGRHWPGGSRGDPGGRPGPGADGRLPDAAGRHARMRRGRGGAYRPRRRDVIPAVQPPGPARPHRHRLASGCCAWRARPRWAGWT